MKSYSVLMFVSEISRSAGFAGGAFALMDGRGVPLALICVCIGGSVGFLISAAATVVYDLQDEG